MSEMRRLAQASDFALVVPLASVRYRVAKALVAFAREGKGSAEDVEDGRHTA